MPTWIVCAASSGTRLRQSCKPVRVLVTGGSGFVGQHLLRELLQTGHSVAAGVLGGASLKKGTLSPEERAHVHWISLDVTSGESIVAAVEECGPERIYHLAAQSSVNASFADPLATWEVNATGTLRLLDVLSHQSARRARVLVVSSAEVYGIVPEREQPISESRPLAPATPYGASKAAAEMAALQANATGEVEVVIARSFNHIGPGQEEHFALPGFTRQLMEMRLGKRAPVLQVGNLQARRDLLDVRDVVCAYRRLMERGETGGIYNVCSGEPHVFAAVVEELVALSGTGARMEVDPAQLRPVDLPLLTGDPRRIRSLGWQPEIPLRETIRDILQAAEIEAIG